MKLRFTSFSRGVVAVTLALTFGLAAGCGSDAPSKYTLALSVDRTTLTADGSDSATIRVTILDQNGYPPAIGSTVLMQAQNGLVNASGTDQGDSLTDATGTAQFTVTCDPAGDGESVRALALYEGETGFLLEEIECQPAPSGDWTVLASATPRQIPPGGRTTIVADAVDGQGAPVPEGTALTFSINAPNPGAQWTFSAADTVILPTQDPSGRISVNVVAPETEDNFTVCVSFTDQRYSQDRRCITVTVGTAPPAKACLGVYAPSRVAGDGESLGSATFTVFDDDGQAIADSSILAEIELGTFLEDPEDPDSGTDTVELTTDSSGTAEVVILAPDRTGTADVTAFATIDGEDVECEFDDTLVFFPPPTCEFDTIGTLDLGDTRSVKVCFFDFDQPVPEGRRVNFELVSAVGGTTLTATTAFTDETGCAVTGVATGAVPGGVTIRASMPFGLTEASCQSEATIQRGGVGTANQMTLACTFRNLGVYLTRNGVDITNGCSMVCQANIADQFNNPVEGEEVYFTTEAGTIDSVATTNAAGVASAVFYARGLAPLDVPPSASEPIGPGVGVDTTLNPRDSLVTIVASTVGQEMFNDADGDGVYDEGEYFIDLPEPFVDANEDDAYTPGGSHETFTDVAVPGRPLNGEFDGPNGTWDAFTQIWAATHVVYSGQHFGGLNGGFTWFPGGLGGGAPMPDPIRVGGVIEFRPRDEYGNTLSSGVTSFNASTTCDTAEVEVSGQRTGDWFGVLAVGRDLANFLDGRQVGEDAPTPDFGRFQTFLRFFESVPGDNGGVGPGADVVFNADAVGAAEDCTLTIEWNEQGSSDCSEGSVARSVTFAVSLPTRSGL